MCLRASISEYSWPGSPGINSLRPTLEFSFDQSNPLPSERPSSVIACTGNTGCKFAMTNTKGQAVELARYLERKVHLDHPINIHLTGCPNSCAQHYIGDIGLLSVKIGQNENQREAYHVFFGGRVGYDQRLGQQVFHGLFSQTQVGDRPLTPTKKKVAIYYGSETGNAEAFAKRAAKAAVQRGFDSAAVCMDKINLQSLASEQFALFVTSTYGDGR
jgi:sulfite reductase beta subunit-like hemoprotein